MEPKGWIQRSHDPANGGSEPAESVLINTVCFLINHFHIILLWDACTHPSFTCLIIKAVCQILIKSNSKLNSYRPNLCSWIGRCKVRCITVALSVFCYNTELSCSLLIACHRRDKSKWHSEGVLVESVPIRKDNMANCECGTKLGPQIKQLEVLWRC